jgi:hypothetical protein
VRLLLLASLLSSAVAWAQEPAATPAAPSPDRTTPHVLWASAGVFLAAGVGLGIASERVYCGLDCADRELADGLGLGSDLSVALTLGFVGLGLLWWLVQDWRRPDRPPVSAGCADRACAVGVTGSF